MSNQELKVVGTGFFITRYGLFVTAAHVLEELADWTTNTLGPGYVLQPVQGGGRLIRRILGASLSKTADVAVGQADSFLDGGRPKPVANLRGTLSFDRPPVGSALVSYAYPENELLDMSDLTVPIPLKSNYINGVFRGVVDNESRPYIPYAHYETSLELRSGASGAPVFIGDTGRIVAVACRGWDFQGGEHEGDNLSSIVPVTQLLPVLVGCARIPPDSWEYRQIPPVKRGTELTFAELVTYGHVDVGAV